MTDVVIVAVISGLFTLLGSFFGVVASAKLTSYRIEQLERKWTATTTLRSVFR